jgi:hypothetical protein
MMGCFRSIGCLAVLVLLAAGAYLTRDMWMQRPAFGPWAPLTADGAAVTRRAIERLSAPKGPAYVQLTGAEFASFALKDRVPGDAQAAVIDDRLHVRERGLIELAGTIDVPRSGVGQFRATEITVGHVALPQAVIPRLFHGADSVTVGLPTAVGDIRVAHGFITLYKKIP